ncbi:MAG: hypothetical protein PWP23_349 [Candidatus Sumerlaeota bacterium]|nr:hypothetical protein [Candidatus Sumerlaeota bacterium]
MLAATGAVALLAGCGAKNYHHGEVEIVVMNDGEAEVSGVRVEHGLDSYNYGTVFPGESETNRFEIASDSPMVLRYVTADGVLKEEEYELRVEPEHGGTVEMHIDRDGETRLTSRFYLY